MYKELYNSGIQVHGLREKVTYLENVLSQQRKTGGSAAPSAHTIQQSSSKSGFQETFHKAMRKGDHSPTKQRPSEQEPPLSGKVSDASKKTQVVSAKELPVSKGKAEPVVVRRDSSP